MIIELLRPLAGLVTGLAVGAAFGLVQDSAFRRNQRRQAAGELKQGWAVMPGSMRRTAYLVMALVLVQIVCPPIFSEGAQWWVSGGVVLGYGAVMYRLLRHKLSQHHG